VRVKVNEPRCDELALGVNGLFSACRYDALFDGGDLAKTDTDVANAAKSLARVDDISAADYEVELREWLLAHGAT
jgi:hypothetical protein